MKATVKTGLMTFLAAFLHLSVASATTTDLHILSATVKNKNVEGAEVILQKNGMQSRSGVTDARGEVSIDTTGFGGDDDATLMIVKKEGYSNLVVQCPCDDMTYALSKNMATLDGLRVVLNWGENPADLDSHLVFPGNHIYFESKTGEKAGLDVDDTSSYGPETITIERKQHGKKYIYAVHNYSDRKSEHSSALSKSQAKVMVYIGQTLIKTYYARESAEGTLWILFGINETGEFYDFNTYVNASTSKGVGVALRDLLNRGEFDNKKVTSPDAITKAKVLNRKGEAAYHEGDFDGSILFYQGAIELYSDYGQAYSNLGLSFKKSGRIAEAIWANRKAIALAYGKRKHIVQASSYYNIAKIYESQGKWVDAKQNYTWALEKREHSAYTQGIARMTEKLNQE